MQAKDSRDGGHVPHPFEVARAALLEGAATETDPHWVDLARQFARLLPDREDIAVLPDNVIRGDFRRAS